MRERPRAHARSTESAPLDVITPFGGLAAAPFAGILALAALLLLAPRCAFPWDGPPQTPGSGIANMLKPASYIDGNFQSLISSLPQSDSRVRGNFILASDGTDTVQLNAHAQRYRLDGNLALADASTTVPWDLWNLGAGGSFGHRMKNGDSWSANASVGSASDVPFNSFHEMDFQATGTYVDVIDSRHTWIFFLNFSTARAFAPGVPLPGAGYFVRYPGDRLQVFYGLPFFLSWDFADDWNARFSYFIPVFINAEVSRRLSSTLKLHTGFQWTAQTWLRANRTDTQDELILDQKEATLGLRVAPGERFYADFSGGYAFYQDFFEAHSYFSSGITKSPLPAGIIAQIQLAYQL